MKMMKISRFSQLRKINEVAMNSKTYSKNYLKIQDYKGSIANARSILGMMSLDYNYPVKLTSDSEDFLDLIDKAVKSV